MNSVPMRWLVDERPHGYAPGLARAHDDGSRAVAEAAAETAATLLNDQGHDRGLVVDLGCGSGVTARLLTAAGYDVLGVDLSPAMIELARRQTPEARFTVGSVYDAEIPAGAVGVLAIGEVINYAFDPRAGPAGLDRLVGRVAAALAPGGLFLLDTAEPGRAGPCAYKWTDTPGWTVCGMVEEAGDRLTRQIVTFVRDGDRYRREDETHVLALLDPGIVEATLRGHGLRVRRLDGYRDQRFPGWSVWLATTGRRGS
jgi:SAM-dependent methyltransferase